MVVRGSMFRMWMMCLLWRLLRKRVKLNDSRSEFKIPLSSLKADIEQPVNSYECPQCSHQLSSCGTFRIYLFFCFINISLMIAYAILHCNFLFTNFNCLAICNFRSHSN
jgi:hypothetical protein